jgi:hypothetical protein
MPGGSSGLGRGGTGEVNYSRTSFTHWSLRNDKENALAFD